MKKKAPARALARTHTHTQYTGKGEGEDIVTGETRMRVDLKSKIYGS